MDARTRIGAPARLQTCLSVIPIASVDAIKGRDGRNGTGLGLTLLSILDALSLTTLVTMDLLESLDDIAVMTNSIPFLSNFFGFPGQAGSPSPPPVLHRSATGGADSGFVAPGVHRPASQALDGFADASTHAHRSVSSPLSLLQWAGTALASALNSFAPAVSGTANLSAVPPTPIIRSKRGRDDDNDDEDDDDDEVDEHKAPAKKRTPSNSQVRKAYTNRWVETLQKGTPIVVDFGPTFTFPFASREVKRDDEMDDDSTASDTTPRPVHGTSAVDAMDVDDSADQPQLTSTSQNSSRAYFSMDEFVSASASIHLCELTAHVSDFVKRLRQATILRYCEAQVDLSRPLMHPAVCDVPIVIGLHTRDMTFGRLLERCGSTVRRHVAIVASLRDDFATLALVEDNGQLLVFTACSRRALSNVSDAPPIRAAGEITLGDDLDHEQLGALAGGSEPLRATVLRVVITGATINNILTYRWLLLRLPHVTRIVFALSAVCGSLKLVAGEVQLPLSARHILHILTTVVNCAERPRVEIEEDINLQDIDEFGAALNRICCIRIIPTARFS